MTVSSPDTIYAATSLLYTTVRYTATLCATAILCATQMPLDERKERWRNLINSVTTESLTAWKERFLCDLRGKDADGSTQPFRRWA